MKRIWKFRAWDGKQMIPWNELNHHPLWWLFADEHSLGWIIMQGTGRLDKNGVEIFEGDCLVTSNDGQDGHDKWEEEPSGIVKWDRVAAKFYGLPDNDEDSMYGYQYCRIVGNIYENPELE